MIPARATNKEFLEGLGFDAVYIGKEPIFDLKQLPKLSKSIRQALNRARRLGIEIIEYDERHKASIEALCSKWQDNREVPALQFLFQLRTPGASQRIEPGFASALRLAPMRFDPGLLL